MFTAAFIVDLPFPLITPKSATQYFYKTTLHIRIEPGTEHINQDR